MVAEHELVRPIGAGAGGEVWLAKSALGTYRAVKVVYRKTFSWAKAYEDEFHGLLKYEPLSRQHDGLVDVLQVGGNAEAGYFYYVMELADDLRTGPNINPDNYEPSALHFLHRQELIHRDVKPANIVFVNGFPKLADAGLVTEMFKTGSRVGTEGYIAPEGPGTARADIYSLGKVLYEISTGKNRNDYPELPAEMGKPAEERDLVQFCQIVVKACRTNPRLRYQDAGAMMSDLLAFQFHTPMPFDAKNIKVYAGWFGLAGLFVAIVVVLVLLWRLFQFLLRSE